MPVPPEVAALIVGLPMPILLATRVGSRVYGTARPDSDHDVLVVGGLASGRDLRSRGDVQVTLLSRAAYEEALGDQRIFALEALFAPDEHRFVDEVRWRWTLQRSKLATEVDERSRADLAKGLRTWADDPEKARKRIFHAIRVPTFAVQVVREGRITDFSAANDVFLDLWTEPGDAAAVEARWAPVRQALCAEVAG